MYACLSTSLFSVKNFPLIKIPNFLKQFRSRFFPLLSKGFSFVEKDLLEKEKILHELHAADPTHYDTVNNMVSWECRTGAPSKKVTTLIIREFEPKGNL